MIDLVKDFIKLLCLASYFREGHRVIVYYLDDMLQYDIISYLKPTLLYGKILLDTAVDLPPNNYYPTLRRKSRVLFFNDIVELKIELLMFNVIMFRLLNLLVLT